MKIIKLSSENILKLKAIEIEPNSNMVVISGKNEAGKTSILDSIYMALTGKLPKKPIREGQEKAIVKIDTDTDLVITRTIIKNGNGFNPYLRVEDKEGNKLKKPQDILNKLIGKLTFDPLSFSKLKPLEQKELLLKTIDIDLKPLEKKRELIFNERTIENRDCKVLESQLKEYQNTTFDNIPDEYINIDNVMKEIDNINIELLEAERNKSKIELINNYILKAEKEIKELKNQLELLNKDLSDEIKKNIDTKPLLIKKDQLLEKVNSATFTNNEINKKKEYGKKLKDFEKVKNVVNNYTQDIKDIDEAKTELIENANIPVKGLSVNDDGVVLNNIPFSQLSSAQKLKVSMAIAIEMNPELRIIKIQDGSLLDKESFSIIENMAKDRDFQVWIEVVDETGKLGVYIEDGEIKG